MQTHSNNRTLPFFIRTNDNLISFVYYRTTNNGETCYIGFPKLLPTTTDGDVTIIGQPYIKGKDYAQWFRTENPLLNKYKTYIPAFDNVLFCFPSTNVNKIFHPQDFKYSETNSVQDDINNIMDALISKVGIESNSIGVEGSVLLGTNGPSSDLDLLIYGYNNAEKLANSFSRINTSLKCRTFQTEDYVDIYSRRKDLGYGNTYNTVIKQDLRRFYGYTGKRRFSIIPVLDNTDRDPICLERSIKFIKNYSTIIKITDSKYGIVTPSVYIGEDLNGDYGKMTVEIHSHYGVNQAKVNERIQVEGPLYYDKTSRKYLIIISFWSQQKQSFNLAS